MAKKRGKKTAIALYFVLLVFLLILLIIHAFKLYPLDSGFFTRYLVAMIFVLMTLPLIPKIKIFDIVDIKREARMFRMNRKK
ncbi:hypothetical protein CMO88_01105 [Candidatus Woesearchaeota archaeon]|nr:hypothetical protein [Candidatus Woesearchaeota archaeon]|tara:strand:- start:1854 stop:2099 length:246 start_codon:yes stop_codon:yes gene_type:complete